MINLTSLEVAMLAKIALDLYQPTNGREPETFEDTSDVWLCGIAETKSEGGVLSSLSKKGLVAIYDYGDDAENTVRLTQAGFDAYKASK